MSEEESKVLCVGLSNNLVVIGKLVEQTGQGLSLVEVSNVISTAENETDAQIYVSELFPGTINLIRPLVVSYSQIVCVYEPSDVLMNVYESWCEKILNGDLTSKEDSKPELLVEE